MLARALISVGCLLWLTAVDDAGGATTDAGASASAAPLPSGAPRAPGFWRMDSESLMDQRDKASHRLVCVDAEAAKASLAEIAGFFLSLRNASVSRSYVVGRWMGPDVYELTYGPPASIGGMHERWFYRIVVKRSSSWKVVIDVQWDQYFEEKLRMSTLRRTTYTWSSLECGRPGTFLPEHRDDGGVRWERQS